MFLWAFVSPVIRSTTYETISFSGGFVEILAGASSIISPSASKISPSLRARKVLRSVGTIGLIEESRSSPSPVWKFAKGRIDFVQLFLHGCYASLYVIRRGLIRFNIRVFFV